MTWRQRHWAYVCRQNRSGKQPLVIAICVKHAKLKPQISQLFTNFYSWLTWEPQTQLPSDRKLARKAQVSKLGKTTRIEASASGLAWLEQKGSAWKLCSCTVISKRTLPPSREKWIQVSIVLPAGWSKEEGCIFKLHRRLAVPKIARRHAKKTGTNQTA